MNIWVMMVIAGILTFLTRLSFIWLFERITIPPLIQRALRFVPPSVLAVIIFQELLIKNGHLNVGIANTRMFAGLIAVLVAWKSRNVFLTIGAGMAALVIFNLILG